MLRKERRYRRKDKAAAAAANAPAPAVVHLPPPPPLHLPPPPPPHLPPPPPPQPPSPGRQLLNFLLSSGFNYTRCPQLGEVTNRISFVLRSFNANHLSSERFP